MSQPLRRKAFELAERLGIPAYELMTRMTMPEIREWMEYDLVHIDDSWYQHAVLCAKIDEARGVKKWDAQKYLPEVKRRRKRRSLAEIKAHFQMIAGSVGGAKGGLDGGR